VAAIDGDSSVLLVWDSSAPPRPLDPDDPLGLLALPQTGLEVDVGFVPQCVAFAPAGSLVAVGGAELVLFDALTGTCKPWGRTEATIWAVALSPDGRQLAAGTENGLVELRDTATGRLLRTFDWECGPIAALAFSPDGCTCAAGSQTAQIVVWDRE
jgi:WD40 repeat protein